LFIPKILVSTNISIPHLMDLKFDFSWFLAEPEGLRPLQLLTANPRSAVVSPGTNIRMPGFKKFLVDG
jgi:hypothetical protein